MDNTSDDESVECGGRVFERNPQAKTTGQAGTSGAFGSMQPPGPTREQIAAQMAFYEQYNAVAYASRHDGDEPGPDKPEFDWEAFDRSMGDVPECDGLLADFLAEKAARRAPLEGDLPHRE
ncbi:hypothetical protein pqer_cds_816 [Pandoravirus quercus]|uniref:Uncharacterized protein n=1 Tax=Pandoravirus quercus TaxID=2107709 RepID=A0A2U7U9W3_9VIRU|nr:hypothetical protein pqer_cds_816 [Pandoravirus quercus]AVK75238.1 hypothetical protein pqer_cds_816 [Pandoravirus quercus]